MTSSATASRPDTRSPLEVAAAIAGRFMRTPRQEHYMWRVAMVGILDLYRASGEQRYLDFYLQHLGDKPRFDYHLYEVTGDTRFLTGMQEDGEKFLANPRRDREGCFLDPRGRYTVDVVSHYFAHPVLLGHLLKDHRYFDEALRQLEIPRSYLEDPGTGLWYSRCGHSLHPNRPNPGLWSRGNGWLVAAWSRVMHLWDPRHAAYAHVLALWRRYAAAVAACQTSAGTFRQLLIRPASFEEASGTALFTTGFSLGVLHGTLEAGIADHAWRAFCGLRALSDAAGNLHNGSTYAGGYNFEYQYHTCGRYNEPHATATAISGCANLAWLMKKGQTTIDTREPVVRPVIVTVAEDSLMVEPPHYRQPDEVAAPALARVLALTAWPEHDLFAGTIRGLTTWHDWSKHEGCLPHADRLLGLAQGRITQAAWWNAAGELALRRGDRAVLAGLKQFVDGELPRVARDRKGLFLDDAGGYRVETLATWLPLLAKAATFSGDLTYVDEACRQLLGHQAWMEEPITRLWHSAFGRGAHPRRRTPGFWGLGNTYVFAAAVELLPAVPRTHDRYVDVVGLIRGLAEVFHTYFPVSGGFTQRMDVLGSFPCVRATALATYACGKALLAHTIHHAYYAVTWGGNLHLSDLVGKDGRTAWSSLPSGGLDVPEAYESHRSGDDPAALGDVLAACAMEAACAKIDIDFPSHDGSLGAR